MAAALPISLAPHHPSRQFISLSLTVLELSRGRNAKVPKLSLQPQSFSWRNLSFTIPHRRQGTVPFVHPRGMMHTTGAISGTAYSAAETATSTPTSVRTRINYIQPPKKGERLSVQLGGGVSSLLDNVADVEVLDTRHLAEAPTIDRHGFQVVRIEPLLKDYDDDDEVKEVLYPAVVEAVKRVTGASEVEIFFGHLRRRRRDLPTDQLYATQRHVWLSVLRLTSSLSLSYAPTQRHVWLSVLRLTKPLRDAVCRSVKSYGPDNQPVKNPHTDYTLKSGVDRLIFSKGEEVARSLLKHRFAIIQFWMPTKGPVYDAPLALMDPSTIQPEDCHFTDFLLPGRVHEMCQFSPNRAHKWYYTSLMKPTEAYLFKGYDSREDVARSTPHAAFLLPDIPEEAPRRESIEIRMFAFWDK